LEVVIYSDNGFPGLANDFDFNYGGMRFNSALNYDKGEQLVVNCFIDRELKLVLKGEFLRQEGDAHSVIKFEPVSDEQRKSLTEIMGAQ
jgi:hypothetical protein